jgi:RNA polymerase sigma-70 factor (ECF subfamily)
MTNTNGFGTQADPPQSARAEAPHLTEADLSKRDLVGRAKSGDRDALQALLAGARPRLSAVALKMVKNRDDAEDVVQEAMLKVWRYVGRFEERAALSTWLHRIVVNTALDHLRAKRSGAAVTYNGDEVADEDRRAPEAVHDETAEDLLARAQVGFHVRGAISQLSPVHREVIALRELDGESYQSIAEIARCPVGTVMSRLHHARGRLAETLLTGAAGLLPQAA